MTTRLAWVMTMFAATACGDYVSAPLPKDKTPPVSGVLPSTFDVNMQTPGVFRDMYRILVAQAQLDDGTAVERMKIDLPRRLDTLDQLPQMSALDHASVEALLILAVRGIQATESNARVARLIGERMIGLLLALDPARVAWNDAHPGDQVEALRGGASLVATASAFALDNAGASAGATCTLRQAATGAQWNPGQPQQVWVPERCEADRVIEGYCEPDRWVEGECYETWVDGGCDGDYVDRGRYEYRCYGANDCRTIWVSRWVYEEDCSSGYWEEDCYPDRFEEGLCYPDRFEPGFCEAGHYETQYTGGSWSYPQYATAPAECAAVRPGQGAIAVTSVQVLRGKVYDDVPSEWRGALDALATSGQLTSPTEATLDALQQILAALQ